MGFFDGASFQAPNVNAAVPSLENFINYKDSERRKQFEFEKELENFRSQQAMRNFRQQMDMENIKRASIPLNVAPPTGLVTSAMQYQGDIEKERNKAIAENTGVRNQIAQQNADTRLKLGEEGFDVRRDIAEGANTTRKDIAGMNITSREGIADKNIAGRSALEDQRQGNRATNLDTRGEQSLANIAAAGGEARLTKAVPSPNVNANNPSQQGIAEKQRANEFINRNPQLAQWVTFDPNTGMVSITPPSNKTSLFGGANGPSVDDYHRILAGVYGTPSSAAAPPTSTLGNPNEKVRVEVTMPDGTKKIGYMPRGKANQPGIRILGGG